MPLHRNTRKFARMLGRHIAGRTTGTISDRYGVVDHVADAYTERKYLVVLDFAQRRFHVAVSNVEAKTDEEATKLAVRRSRNCYPDLGNIMKAEVVADTEENRKKYRLGAGTESHVEYSRTWKNVA